MIEHCSWQPFLKGAAVLLSAVCCLVSGTSDAFSEGCDAAHVDLRGTWGQARFHIDLADEPHERQRGLMFRREMAQSTGMLFVYSQEQPVTFWMRNTYLPLDLIFADRRGVVQRVHENAQPLDETLIPGGERIQYVLEVNAGQAQRLGLSVGTQMRHPAIAAAAWPCETDS